MDIYLKEKTDATALRNPLLSGCVEHFLLRPLFSPALKYELVIKRSSPDGSRVYERHLCYLNKSDAETFFRLVPDTEISEAY